MSNNKVLPNELLMIVENAIFNASSLNELLKLKTVHSTFYHVFKKYILTCQEIFETINETNSCSIIMIISDKMNQIDRKNDKEKNTLVKIHTIKNKKY